MRVPLPWLREYCDPALDVHAIEIGASAPIVVKGHVGSALILARGDAEWSCGDRNVVARYSSPPEQLEQIGHRLA